MAFSTLGLKPKPKETNDTSNKVQKSLKPSDKLNPKTVDPFDIKKMEKSAFGIVYANGGIPCRLAHGSVKNRLTWNVPIENVPFDPVLVTLSEGLKETIHPFSFVSQEGFKELLQTIDAREKVYQVLPKIILPVKNALASETDSVFEAGLNALVQLSDTIGPVLNQYLKVFLSALCKRVMQRKYRDFVTDALNKFEQNGGNEVVKIIRTKIPTYNCIS